MFELIKNHIFIDAGYGYQKNIDGIKKKDFFLAQKDKLKIAKHFGNLSSDPAFLLSQESNRGMMY